ncbi:MAG: hypothetical protein KDA60_16500 [Planctomycetales bacterium]|nr:hypothetical protein [Planctomycetales bacterium]
MTITPHLTKTHLDEARRLNGIARDSRFLLVLIALAIAFSLTGDKASSDEPFAGILYEDRDCYSDTWVATDALGRQQPDISEVGPVRANRFVGIFYWTWHVRRGSGGPNDNTKLIQSAKDGMVGWPDNGCPHHWGEPELGYYMMTDPFVLRKHASMLADAGIDVVFFDTTNPPFTWKDEYEALCRVYTEMRAEGNRTPAICFLCPFGDPTSVLNQVWTDLYQPGKWQDLWFRWEGKPLILADPAFIKEPDQREFFTFRRPMPDYWKGPSGANQWSWLETFPQHVFRNDRDEVEQMSVGVAQNALTNTPGPAPMSHRQGAMGRSWHDGARDLRPDAVNWGLNFDEQWRRAIELDPKFIFVTGWNEWIAGRFQKWHIYSEQDAYFRGGLFVDQYDQEYSRDCEPMAGGHTDNYYYQLAAWVRRYKGVRPIPKAASPSTIAIDGQFSDWEQVAPEYRDTIGDVKHRDHRGYGDLVYRNSTGRNDFVICKAAYDSKNLYFFTQTRSPITPHTDPMWMLLLLDTDQNGATGWLGYDYVVNREVISETTTRVMRWQDGDWKPLGEATYRVAGNGLELAVSRALIDENSPSPAFDFHWADNIHSYTGVAELGVNGDSAPNRRWNYRFEVAR